MNQLTQYDDGGDDGGCNGANNTSTSNNTSARSASAKNQRFMCCHCERHGCQSPLYKYNNTCNNPVAKKQKSSCSVETISIPIPHWFQIPTCVLVERRTGHVVQWSRLCECLEENVMEALQNSTDTSLHIDISFVFNQFSSQLKSSTIVASRKTPTHQWSIQMIEDGYALSCYLYTKIDELHCCALQPSKHNIVHHPCVCMDFSKPASTCQQCSAYDTDFMIQICQQEGVCKTCKKSMFDVDGADSSKGSSTIDNCCECTNLRKFVHFMYQYKKQHNACVCDILQHETNTTQLCNMCKINAIIESHVDKCNKECCFYPLLALNRYRRAMACRHPRPPLSTTKYRQETLACMFHQINNQYLLNNHVIMWEILTKATDEFRMIQSLMPPGRVLYVKKVYNSSLYKMYRSFQNIYNNYNTVINNKERALWHGTSIHSTKNISKRGFNRDYTQVCQYGKGVYFSVDSNYSLHDRYSPRDGDIKCLVLGLMTIGDCTVGTKNQQSLPEITFPNGLFQKTHDTFVDSESNPMIVVAPLDHQVYPAYVVYVV